MSEQEQKNLEAIRQELFETDRDNFFQHDGMLLFMSVRKAARVRREIEGTMVKLMQDTQSGQFSDLDHDLDRMSSLRRYERRSRSEVAKRVLKNGKEVTSKLSDLRRKIARERGGQP